jgi:hypothetical protein
MSRRLVLAAVTVAASAAVTLSGCGRSTSPSSAASAANTPPPAAAEPAGDLSPLPDICTLLSKAEVTTLTRQPVASMNNEGGTSPNARYCQWLLDSGQLTVAVDIETREQFDVRNKQATPVSGVGDTAYELSGHLYVYRDNRVVDVYASLGGSDANNLAVEKSTATQVLPRLFAASAPSASSSPSR